MSKFMPPEPSTFFIPAFTTSFDMSSEMLYKEDFDAWYAREIAPLFENSFKVCGYVESDGYPKIFGQVAPDATHSALLINIKPLPVKEESAEDLLREMVDALRADLGDSIIYSKLFEKAETYLEKRKAGQP